MFVRAANPVWYFVDLIGLGLNDQYYAFFLTNTLPYQPQPVYRDPQGLNLWPDPLQFFPNGTLPNNLYFDPTLVYRIEIRQGQFQSDPLIYEINNFSPGGGGGTPGSDASFFSAENQISNSQFSDISFVSPLVITTAGTHSIAPGWDLILTGAGSITVTRYTLSGDQFPANPPIPFPYALGFDSTMWSSVILQQRFNNNGALWSLGSIAGSIEGTALVVTDQPITMNYIPSDSTTAPGEPTQIFTGNLVLGTFQTVGGAAKVNFTGNTDLGINAYVDIQIVLPPEGNVELTNIQIIGNSEPLPDSFDQLTDLPVYQQETNERMVDHLFHYYSSQLILKPKKSLLTGWSFSLNPFQFIAPAVTTVAAQSSYICDQTILYQNIASQLQTGQNTVDNRLNLTVKAVTDATDTRFALIQYIDPATVMPYWSYVLSAFARARIFTTNSSVRLKCRLIYRNTLPPVLGANEPIASWPMGDDPVFAAGWTALEPLNDPAYVLPNAYSSYEVAGGNAYPGFSFDQFQMPVMATNTMVLGIVLYTMDNMNATNDPTDYIAFDRVSLIPSYFGADAEAQSYDEVLRQCQYYWEQSYPANTIGGSVTSAGLRRAPNAMFFSDRVYVYVNNFNLVYNQIKRAVPVTTFYNPAGTPGTIYIDVWDGSGYPAASVGGNPAPVTVPGSYGAIVGSTSSIYLSTTVPLLASNFVSLSQTSYAEIVFHYTADARMGIS